jgi:hypothetical protein
MQYINAALFFVLAGGDHVVYVNWKTDLCHRNCHSYSTFDINGGLYVHTMPQLFLVIGHHSGAAVLIRRFV